MCNSCSLLWKHEAPKLLLLQKIRFFFFFLLLRIPHTTNFEPLLDMLGVLGVDTKEKIHVAN